MIVAAKNTYAGQHCLLASGKCLYGPPTGHASSAESLLTASSRLLADTKGRTIGDGADNVPVCRRRAGHPAQRLRLPVRGQVEVHAVRGPRGRAHGLQLWHLQTLSMPDRWVILGSVLRTLLDGHRDLIGLQVIHRKLHPIFDKRTSARA